MARFTVIAQEWTDHSPIYVISDTLTGQEVGRYHVTDGLRPDRRAQDRADLMEATIPAAITDPMLIMDMATPADYTRHYGV